MHRYASQTPEARELVEELEFVWDQIKANTSSSSASAASSSSPLRNSVGVPPLQYPQMQAPPSPRQQSLLQQRGYGSIGGRMAHPAYEDMVAIANANNHHHHHRNNGRGESSRLRVLSPVSQPDGMYQRRGSGMRDYEYDAEERNPEDDEEDEEEQYEEAQDTFDEDDDDHDHDQYNNTTSNDGHHNQEDANTEASSLQQHHSNNTPSSQSISRNPSKPSKSTQPTDTRRWRRRVEQALTKMTAEVAAVREQMETRAIAHRRRTSAWAWVKWLAWVTLRQVLWDLAVLAMLLIWMRVKGDRRVEERLKDGWVVLRGRLGRLRVRRFRV